MYAQLIRRVRMKLRALSPYRFDDDVIREALALIANDIPVPERHSRRRELVTRTVRYLLGEGS